MPTQSNLTDHNNTQRGTLISIHKIDYTVQDKETNPEPIIHLFGRTPKGRLSHIRVHGFQPYFYAPTNEVSNSDTEDKRIVETEKGYNSIQGESLTRIYTRIPADVGEIRDQYTHYEADILFPNRFRIDKKVKSGIEIPRDTEPTTKQNHDIYDLHESEITPAEVSASLRTMVLDIEVDDRNGFPENGEEEIIAITTWDSFNDEYRAWGYKTPIQKELDYDVKSYDKEDEMLRDFIKYLNEVNSDIICGWNSNDFDLPYIIDRMDKLGLNPDELSRVNEVWHSGWGGPTIKGRTAFDLLYGYQRMRFSEMESYRLDAIAEEELGESKIKFTGKVGDLWETNPEKLIEYNKIDVELCVEIDKKVGIIDFFQELAGFVGCSLEDSTTPSDVVDLYVLRKAHQNFILPSKGTAQTGEEYEGGEVFEPITGIRENVMVLDLKSLYPMSMVTINASPETKVDPDFDGETYSVEMPDGAHVRFRKDREGLTKNIVNELLEEREKKKELRNQHDIDSDEYYKYDNQQTAIKVVMNCFTGDTEVITEEGVKNIKDIEVGEHVYSINPKTKKVKLKEVVATQRQPYQGEMIDIKTRHTDFSVTPNHRILVDANDETKFVEADDLNNYTNYQIPAGEPIEGRKPNYFDVFENCSGIDNVYIQGKIISDGGITYNESTDMSKCSAAVFTDDLVPKEKDNEIFVSKHGHKTKKKFLMENWLRFIGWYVTEGSLYRNKISGNYVIAFGQINKDGRKKIHSLLKEMGFNAFKNRRDIRCYNSIIYKWLSENCGIGSENKKLPEFVFNLDSSLLHVLFETLIEGDGDTYSGIRYSTKSNQLKDDMVRLAIHLGYKPMVNRDSGVWRIRFSDNKGTFRMHRNGDASTNDDGAVYCLTVEDNHTVMAGRNGKFQWTGNSYYGVAGYDRFRLYDREMGSAVTATGRKVIEFTKEVIEDIGYNVIYGDTDSTVVELGPEKELEEVVEIGHGLEDQVNESYDDFAWDEFNAENHRWEIEFEKVYRRFFQAGKKKRYAGHLIWKEGEEVDEIDITGFEYARSDVSRATREVQKEVIDMIVKGGDFSDVAEYLNDVVERFKSGELDLDYAGIPGGIGKKLDNYETDTAHVKGAKYANEYLGTSFRSGSKPKRIYIKRVAANDEGYPDTEVVCFEYPEQVPDCFEVDWDKMLGKTIRKPISRILEALDWSWSEVVSNQRQEGLGNWT